MALQTGPLERRTVPVRRIAGGRRGWWPEDQRMRTIMVQLWRPARKKDRRDQPEASASSASVAVWSQVRMPR